MDTLSWFRSANEIVHVSPLEKNRRSSLLHFFLFSLCIVGWPWPWLLWPCYHHNKVSKLLYDSQLGNNKGSAKNVAPERTCGKLAMRY